MKVFFVVLLLMCMVPVFATNYYVSMSGSDAANGSQVTPWRTINKVNSSTFAIGDSILFRRGDTWNEQLNVPRSGSASGQIYFDAYGTGARPLITGMTSIPSWINIGTNLWQSSSPLPGTNKVQVVTIGGQDCAMGRYPNYFYRTIGSASGTTSITDPTLPNTQDWTGAHVVLRTLHPQISNNIITAHNLGIGQLTYTATTTNPGQAGFGYFITDHISTLDTAGEWFVSGTRYLTVYNIGSPTNVQASTIDTVFNATNRSYVTVKNLDIQGASTYCMSAGGFSFGVHDTIVGNNVNGAGRDGIHFRVSNGNYVGYNTVSNCHSSAIVGTSEGGTSVNLMIEGNVITNSGQFAGMGATGNPNYDGIYVNGSGATIRNNAIIRTGYCPVFFIGDNCTVTNNNIDTYCNVVDDGGGVYTYTGKPQTIRSGRTIAGNFIANGIGAPAGTKNKEKDAVGVYLDDGSTGVTVINNSISNAAYSSIYLHNVNNITVSNNTLYNSGIAELYNRADDTSYIPTTSVVFSNNKVAPILGGQVFAVFSQSGRSDISTMYSRSDSNTLFHKPFDTTYRYNPATGPGFSYSVANWNTAYGYDAHSVQLVADSSTNYVANQSDTVLTYNFLGLIKKRFDGTVVSNSDNIAPRSSMIYIANGGSVTPPVANAGVDQLLAFGTTSTTLSGSGYSTSGGTITGYMWTQISGAAATITSPSTASTNITGLNVGTYVFRLTVTDSNTLTGSDDVQITVNPDRTGCVNCLILHNTIFR